MTFSIEVPAVSSAPRLQAQPVRVGVEGGAQTAQVQLSQAQAGFDLAPLEQLGSGLLKEHMKAAQDAAFYRGIQRSMEGEVAADMEAERPAWASAFGTSPAVAGARYNEQVSDSAALERTVMEAMPEARKLPPEEFTKLLRQNIAALKTGDPTRDMILDASAVQFVPGAMKMHLTAHMDWNQKVAAASDEQKVQQVLAAHQATFKANKDAPSEDDLAIESSNARVRSLFMVPEGVEPEAHLGRVVQGLQAQVVAGQFGAYNLLKNDGMLGKLPLRMQDALTSAADTAARRYVSETAPEWAVIEQVRLYNDMSLNGKALIKEMDKLNAKVAQATGIENAKYLPDTVRDNWLQARENYGKSIETKNRTLAERQAKQDGILVETENAKNMILSPMGDNGQAAVKLADMDKEVRDGAVAAAYRVVLSEKDPKKRIEGLVGLASKVAGVDEGKPPAAMIQNVHTAMMSPVFSAATEESIAILTSRNLTAAARGKLTGPNQEAAIAQAYLVELSVAGDKPDKQAIWEKAQIKAREGKWARQGTKADEEAIALALDDQNTNKALGFQSGFVWGTATQLGTNGIKGLLRKVMHDEPGIEGETPEQQAQAILSKAHAYGVRDVGGVRYVNMDHTGREWSDYVQAPAGAAGKAAWGRAFADTMKDALKRDADFDIENVTQVIQGQPNGNVGTWIVYYNVPNDKGALVVSKPVTITSAMVGPRMREQIKAEQVEAVTDWDDNKKARADAIAAPAP